MNIYRILDKIKYFPQDLKHFYQRAKKGYSFRDVWSIDYWFMDIMPQMLTDLKKKKHGCPVQFTHNEDGTEKDFAQAMEEWQSVLDRMIFCFTEMNDDTCSMKNEYDEEYSRLKIEEYKNNMKNEGFELFSKYFWNLWD